MDKRFGYFILLGMVIGAIFGIGLGPANENTLAGIGLDALLEIFIGWFIAAAATYNANHKKQESWLSVPMSGTVFCY